MLSFPSTTCRYVQKRTIHHEKTKIMYAARDRYGVRPAFFGKNVETGEVCISSEIKAISEISTDIQPFPPGSHWSSEFPDSFYHYYDYNYTPYKIDEISEEEACQTRFHITRQPDI